MVIGTSSTARIDAKAQMRKGPLPPDKLPGDTRPSKTDKPLSSTTLVDATDTSFCGDRE
jgi:hypothetical protein